MEAPEDTPGGVPFGARAKRWPLAPAAQALEERRQVGRGRRRDLDPPAIDRVREGQLERVQRLAIEGDRDRGWPASRPP